MHIISSFEHISQREEDGRLVEHIQAASTFLFKAGALSGLKDQCSSSQISLRQCQDSLSLLLLFIKSSESYVESLQEGKGLLLRLC